MRIAFFAIVLVLPARAESAELLPMPREVRVDRFGDPLPDGALARLGTTRLRHPGANHLTFNADGTRLVTYNINGRMRIWNTLTGKSLIDRTLLQRVNGVETISDDGCLATFLSEKSLEIWSVDANKLIQKLPLGDAPTFSAVTFSRDNKWVATADFTPREHRIRIWDVETGKSRLVGVQEVEIVKVILSHDGRRLFSFGRGDDGCVAWDVEKGTELWRLQGYYSWRGISRDGAYLLLSHIETPTVKLELIDAEKGKVVGANAWRCNGIDAVSCLSPDGTKVAFVDQQAEVIVLDIKNQKTVHRFPDRNRLMAFSPDGAHLVTIGLDYTLQLIEMKSGKSLYASTLAEGHTAGIRDVRWSPDGAHVASATREHDHTIRLWNTSKTEVIRQPLNLYYGPGFDFVRPGGHLLTPNSNRTFAQFELETGKEKQVTPMVDSPDRKYPFDSISAMRASHSGLNVSLFGRDARSRAFYVGTFDPSTATIRNLRLVELPEFFPFERVVLGPHYLYFAGKIVATESGSLVAEIKGVEGVFRAKSASLSKDERLVAVESRDAVKVCERLTGQIIASIPLEYAGRQDFSPESRYLAIAEFERLRYWDLAQGREVRTQKAHGRFYTKFDDSYCFANCIAFSPDGKRIATGHADTTILIWDATFPATPQAAELNKDQLESLWADLAAPDVKKAWAAIWQLQDRPEQAMKLLRERLKPAQAPPAGEIKKLIDDLDAETFRQRDTTSKQLAEFGDSAKASLEAALKTKPSAEQEKRLKELLSQLDSKQPPRGNDLRAIRALAILEYIKTDEAKRQVEKLAGGLESTRLTREAKETLERLGVTP